MNVFCDTNMLLDVLASRQPFYEDAASVWSLADSGKIRAFVSAITYPNVYYVLRKHLGWQKARVVMREMRGIFDIVACDDQIINQALDADIPDFEDAVQFFSALRAKADYIVTRDADGFAQSTIPVVSPEKFLGHHRP